MVKLAKHPWDREITKEVLRAELENKKDSIIHYTWLKEQMEKMPR